jgi:hypothetical protein
MKIVTNFKLFGREFDLAFRIQKERSIPVYGYTNLCKDGKYIPFFDFDGWELQWVEWSVRYIQDTYKLSSGYIFQSSENGFHVCIFDKLHISDLVKILKSSGTDHNFIFCPINFGKRLWTLRLTEKGIHRPRFIKCIPSPYHDLPKSLPHMVLLEKLYPEIKIDRTNHDNQQTLISAFYQIKE